jgi:hypothetical protein
MNNTASKPRETLFDLATMSVDYRLLPDDPASTNRYDSRLMPKSPAIQRRRVIRRTILSGLIVLTVLLIVVLGSWALWSYHGPAPETEIFRGITYCCERVPETAESGGLCHWMRADLNVPGVSLYVTPMDDDARAHGREYKLRHVSTAVHEDHLAAAINATLFASDSTFIRLPGDLAVSTETVVADHVVNHVDPNTYLFWWDDQRIAHEQGTKPPGASVLARAKWAVGAEESVLQPGYLSGGNAADQRTFVGADPDKKLVWIACFDKASFRFAGTFMARHGAKIATSLDGGWSTTMVIGWGAKHVKPGTATGNWRPVATQFGFRADPLP